MSGSFTFNYYSRNDLTGLLPSNHPTLSQHDANELNVINHTPTHENRGVQFLNTSSFHQLAPNPTINKAFAVEHTAKTRHITKLLLI